MPSRARPLPGLVLALVGLLALLVPAATPAELSAAAPVASHKHLLQQPTPAGLRERAYYLQVPTTGPAGGRALVLVLHGRYQTPSAVMEFSGMEQLARERGFVVAFPSALGGGWNAGTCCAGGVRDQVPDVDFLDRVIADVRRRTPVDPRRVFVAGFSNGGMMAYRYACERSGLVAGIGVVAGAQSATAAYGTPEHPTQCRPARPVSLLHVHGAQDALVPYAGGVVPGSPEAAVAPVRAGLAQFAAAGRCGPATTRTVGRATHLEHQGCSAAGVTKLVKIEGLAHSWTRDSARFGFDTTVGLWSFFEDKRSERCGVVPGAFRRTSPC